MSTFLQRLLERGGRTVGRIREGQPTTALRPAGESQEHVSEISTPASLVPVVQVPLRREPDVEREESGTLQSARIDPIPLPEPDSGRRPISTPPGFLREAGVRKQEQSEPRLPPPVEPRPPADDVGLADAPQPRGRWRALHARLLDAHPPGACADRLEPQARPEAGVTEAGIVSPDVASRPGSIRLAAPASVPRRDQPLVEGPAAGESPLTDPSEVVIQNLDVRILSNSVPSRPVPNRPVAAPQSRGAWTVAARGYLGRL